MGVHFCQIKQWEVENCYIVIFSLNSTLLLLFPYCGNFESPRVFPKKWYFVSYLEWCIPDVVCLTLVSKYHNILWGINVFAMEWDKVILVWFFDGESYKNSRSRELFYTISLNVINLELFQRIINEYLDYYSSLSFSVFITCLLFLE